MSFDDKFINVRRPGIYLHIPFCSSKCGYCDFYSITDQSWRRSFVNSICWELKYYSNVAKSQTFDTIYIGGGTPSVLDINELDSIINTVYREYNIRDEAEITIEINPGTVDLKKMEAFRLFGFNRLSIGAQSFSDNELRLLQRTHSVKDNNKTIRMARNMGFDNINIDLMYALPQQTQMDWVSTLQSAIAQEPEHISAYNLTIEHGTPFHDLKNSGHIFIHSKEAEADFFSLTDQILIKNGFKRYEISNFARSPDLISQHNSKYWDHTPYLGFGPAAHSFWENKRFSNIRSVTAYINKTNRGIVPVDHSEVLSTQTLMFESIFLGLRTTEGINLNTFRRRYNADFKNVYAKPIKILTSNNLATLSSQNFLLTQKGLLLCDEIFPLFLPN